MICGRCLRRASAFRPSIRSFSSCSRQFELVTATPNSPSTKGHPVSTSTGAVQPFSNPLSPTPNPVSLDISLRASPKTPRFIPPVSSCPAGTPLKGINYLKGRDDPVALPEEEYPEWLWHCLDVKKKGEGEETGKIGDEFSKSKKLRRKAAKQQRKLEVKLMASGNMEALAPKIPITQQSIDLPANEEGTVVGAILARTKREELRSAMRRERRNKIKEANYLKGM